MHASLCRDYFGSDPISRILVGSYHTLSWVSYLGVRPHDKKVGHANKGVCHGSTGAVQRQELKRGQKCQDPTNHGFWNVLGPFSHVGSLCVCGLWGPLYAKDTAQPGRAIGPKNSILGPN